MNRFATVLLASVIAPVMVSSASAAVIYGDTADARAYNNWGTTGVGNVTDTSITAGDQDYGNWNDYVSVFQLPNEGAVSNPFSAATASFTLESASGTSWVHLDLYALAARSSASVLTSDNGGGTNVGLSLSTSSTPGVKSTSSANLLSFLNTQYAGGTGAGKYVFFAFRPTDVGSASYTFATADSATEANRPTLSYTAVPEPASLGLLAASALFALRRRRH